MRSFVKTALPMSAVSSQRFPYFARPVLQDKIDIKKIFNTTRERFIFFSFREKRNIILKDKRLFETGPKKRLDLTCLFSLSQARPVSWGQREKRRKN